MAQISVNELLVDPDFSDNFTLIQRGAAIGPYGETVITEKVIEKVVGVVQSGSTDDLVIAPNGARLSDIITVYYPSELSVERPGNGYSDIIVWKGRRYSVQDIVGDWNNYGRGYTKVLAVLEQINNA
jgi:hypothetical protein